VTRAPARCRAASVVAATFLAVLWPGVASAHLVTTGLGPVYDGISHLFVSPDDLVPVLALALLAGLNGPAAGRSALFALTGAWLLGGVCGFVAAAPSLPPASTTISFLLLGVLTALDRRISARLVAGLAALMGLLHGWLNGVGLALAQREGLGLAGIVGATFVVVAIACALVVSLRIPWMRIAVRVAGSWVAAIGLLMLGWSLRGAM